MEYAGSSYVDCTPIKNPTTSVDYAMRHHRAPGDWTAVGVAAIRSMDAAVCASQSRPALPCTRGERRMYQLPIARC